jgi:hypothetical protein
MAKATPQTVETTKSVPAFVRTIADKQRQKDCLDIIDIMKDATGLEPKMWGPAIIGFGSYHYKYESGHEGDAPLVSFSPRKTEFALYIANFEGKESLLAKFGKHKTGKSCVYIKKLEDVEPAILKKLAAGSAKYCKEKYRS